MNDLLTLFRPNGADELHLAAPDIEGFQDAVGVSGGGVSENVLVGTLLSTQAGNTVPPDPDQDRPIEQHKVEAAPDEHCQQEGDEGQSNSRGHHPVQRKTHRYIHKTLSCDQNIR